MDSMPHSWTDIFQSTLSMRRATGISLIELTSILISIHALHEESDHESSNLRSRVFISIHALHEESDQGGGTHVDSVHISIHALHEESDILVCVISGLSIRFQSTLSMRRATLFVS